MLRRVVHKLYQFITSDKNVATFRKIDAFLQKIGGGLYLRTLGQLKYKLRFSKLKNNQLPLTDSVKWVGECENRKNPLVSIIIPNFIGIDNSENLLNAKLQTYQKIELVVVPFEHSDNFLTWIERALCSVHGEVIWIKEEVVNENWLTEMLPLFVYQSTVMVMDTNALKSDEKETIFSDMEKVFHISAVDLAEQMIKKTAFQCNITQMLLKKPYRSYPMDTISSQDNNTNRVLWILDRIRGGTIGCYNRKTNFFDSCKNADMKKSSDEEIEIISCFLAKNYNIDLEIYKKYMSHMVDFEKLLPSLKTNIQGRNPAIIMACYALKSGGGETYPIYLANEMFHLGFSITLVNFGFEDTEEEIFQLINPGIPVINIVHTDYVGQIFVNLRADVIHSHHATVDYCVAMWLDAYPGLGRHIVTLHGMYESVSAVDCTRTIKAVAKHIHKYIYIADKNLDCFKQRGLYEQEKFVKISNGLPTFQVVPYKREKLGIPLNAFVVVLASRAIPEKGWKEAIEAVVLANRHSQRSIHLVLLGDGEMKRKLQKNAPKFIHFMGTVNNVRDFFAMGDVGLLPSTYKGESFPLTIIECLLTGTPVIASDIAEISEQITCADKAKAGLLLPVNNWKIRIEDISEAILLLSTDQEKYNELQKNAESIKDKFNIGCMALRHLQLYQEICNMENRNSQKGGSGNQKSDYHEIG